MVNAIYEQRSGILTVYQTDDGGIERVVYECTGYAGRGNAKNDPRRQDWKTMGPLPCAIYSVLYIGSHATLGLCCFRLIPVPDSRMFGRSGFLIHGDSRTNPGNASHGCIVLNRTDREALRELALRQLQVVPGFPPQAGTGSST